MYFSGRKVGKASRLTIRFLIVLIITSIALPLQAGAVGERARRAFSSSLESLSAPGTGFATGKQDFDAQQVEDPARKAERVTHFRLYPRRLKLYVGEAYTLVAVPLGHGGEVIDGVSTRWASRDENIAGVSSWGEVTAVAAGSTKLTVQAGTGHANIFVEVLDGARPKQTDEEWDAEHGNDSDEAETISLNQSQDEMDEGVIAAQARYASAGSEQLRGALRPAMFRKSATPKVVKAAAISRAAARSFMPPIGYVIDGDGSDTFAFEATQYKNDLGTTRFTAQEEAQGKKHNLGSYDYFFNAPVLSLVGRGIGVNLALNYNSRVWNKDGSTMTFNYNKGWPAAGWGLGYGRIVKNYNNTASGDQTGLGLANRPGDFLLINPDGSRVHLAQIYDSVSGWWKHDATDGSFLHLNDQNGKLKYTDGTVVKYSLTNNRLLPTSVENRNGDLITIVYRNKTSAFRYRWAIDTITDTLGRVIQFHYYGDVDGLGQVIPEYAADDTIGRPATALASITVTDFGGTGARTLVWLNYQNVTMQYSFGAGLTVDSGAPVNGTQLGVLRRIYYPATGRGYVLTNYSGYGMAKKISSRLGMTSSSDGTEIAYTEYVYAETGTLNDSPQFTARNEWWQGKTDSNGTPDNTPTVYTYSRATGAGTEINTVGYPNGLDIVTTTDNSDPSSLTYGKVLSVVYKQHNSPFNLFLESDYTYTFPTDGGIQIGSIVTFMDTWNGLNQRTKIAYDYGSYGRITNAYEYGLKEGGAFNVRRKTAYTYSDDSALLGANMTQVVTKIAVLDALLNNDNTDDVPRSRIIFSYDNYAVKGGMENYGLTTGSYPPNHDAAYDQNKTSRGNLTGVQTFSQINPDVSTTLYTKYDIFGNAVQADVSCCQTKNVGYNSSNYYSQPALSTDGTPGVVPFLTTSYQYDFYTGLLKQMTDPNNLVTSFIYDSAWRLKQTNSPDGSITTTSFDKDGNGNDLQIYTNQLSYTENSTSKVITNRSWFDGAGRPLKTGTGAGTTPSSYDTVAMVYDNLGLTAKRSNPYVGDASGNGSVSYWTKNIYDEMSKVKQTVLADNQTITTVYSGTTTTVTDQVGRQRRSEVDGLGRLVKVTEQNPATGALDATNYLTTYSYDVLDNITQVNQGNQTRTFVYDALSRVKSQTTPESGTVNFTYADSGSVLKRTDARGVETHSKYDSLNRPVLVWYTGTGGDDAGTVRPALPATVGATADVSISYNNYATAQAGNGAVSQIIDQAGSESYSYDSLGRLSAKTRVMDARSYQTQYLYNTASQMTTLIYPSGKRVRSNHDTRGRLSGLDRVDAAGSVLGQYVTSVGYNTAGLVTSFGLSNGVTESYGYSGDRLQLTSQSAVKGASTLMSLTYGYSAGAGASGVSTSAGNSGQMVSISGTINGQARGQAFTYDNLARLVTANGWSSWGRRYAYDRWGNRTGMWDATVGGNQLQNIAVAITGSVANNQIANVNGVTYSYDLSGNVTADGAHSYTYDAEGRQTAVDSGTTATNVYDVNNWRVKKVSGGVATHYVWEGSQVIAEYNATTGALTAEYIYAGARMLARDQGGALKYYHQDRISARLITDASGAVTGTEDHLPFGEEAGVVGESEKHRFTNYERDSERGTDYAVNRQHQYTNGRFMQPDPVPGVPANPQSLNRYTYTLNDPINLTDPLGLYEGCVHQAMTEYLAKLSGRFNAEDSAKLGHFASDEEGGADSKKFSATSFKNAFLGIFGRGPSANIHFASESQLKKLEGRFSRFVASGDFQNAGFVLHAIEDVQGAHLGYHLPFGHLFDGHDPDRLIGDQKFINVSNEVLQFLTGDPKVKLNPAQLNELINAVINRCGKKANQLTITRPRRVGGGGGGIGLSDGGYYWWWVNTLRNFLDWIHSIPVGGPRPEEDHLA